jgi:aspartyl-tRNA(Asn)/glutamyl-tRNA(Gln) amidotransferase subunit C
MTIEIADVKKVARLARLRYAEDELPKVQKELLGIFGWIDQLQSIDVSGVDCSSDQAAMHERNDEILQDASSKEILANAPSANHDMFSVPKVVE